MKGIAVTMLAADSQGFADSRRNEILNLTAKNIVPVQLGSEWILVREIPQNGWTNRIPVRNRIRFQLTTDLDLDTLIRGTRKMGDEAVLYNRFFAPSDGIGLIGIGADWWFEAWVNGQHCGSTWKNGNQEIIFDPEKPSILHPGQKRGKPADGPGPERWVILVFHLRTSGLPDDPVSGRSAGTVADPSGCGRDQHPFLYRRKNRRGSRIPPHRDKNLENRLGSCARTNPARRIPRSSSFGSPWRCVL